MMTMRKEKRKRELKQMTKSIPRKTKTKWTSPPCTGHAAGHYNERQLDLHSHAVGLRAPRLAGGHNFHISALLRAMP